MGLEVFDVDDIYILKNICVSSQCYQECCRQRLDN